jgi:hypothetical protein
VKEEGKKMNVFTDVLVHKMQRVTPDGFTVDEYWVRYKDAHGCWQDEPITFMKDGVALIDYLRFSVPMRDKIEKGLKELELERSY